MAAVFDPGRSNKPLRLGCGFTASAVLCCALHPRLQRTLLLYQPLIAGDCISDSDPGAQGREGVLRQYAAGCTSPLSRLTTKGQLTAVAVAVLLPIIPWPPSPIGEGDPPGKEHS